jgi:hypothetical protein
MKRFTVSLAQTVDADTAEEAALLVYQSLAGGHPPLAFIVGDGETTMTVLLDRETAAKFAQNDHTADPGNW